MKPNDFEYSGYAEMYLHEWTDLLGNRRSEIVLGRPYENIEDAPTRYEYEYPVYKHIGRAYVNSVNGLNLEKWLCDKK